MEVSTLGKILFLIFIALVFSLKTSFLWTTYARDLCQRNFTGKYFLIFITGTIQPVK